MLIGTLSSVSTFGASLKNLSRMLTALPGHLTLNILFAPVSKHKSPSCADGPELFVAFDTIVHTFAFGH